jgi:hypothetical protein
MKARILTVLLSAVLLSTGAEARVFPWSIERDDLGYKPRFVYDVGFDLRFDNREYPLEELSPSGTVFGARLAPAIGFTTSTYKSRHTLMGGVSAYRDFGGSPVSATPFFWYGYERELRKGLSFNLTGGIFPRTTSRELWSTAFFSERFCWYAPYMEGLLLSLDGKDGRIELGCDWMGMNGVAADVKEQFLLSSAAHLQPLKWLRLGYNGYMMHLANSAEAPGVADNILAEPYIEFELGGRRRVFSEFTLRLGYIQSLQRDREVSSEFKAPGLGEFSLRAVRSDLGISNSFYYGRDILPLYACTDTAGQAYADRLYLSDPFFRISPDGSDKAGFYERLELFWAPQLGRNLSLKFAVVFHANSGSYSGCQQIISLNFDLNRYEH